MSIPIENYKKKAKAKRHSKVFIKDIDTYTKRLKENNLPIIFSITHLSKCLNIKPSELLSIAEYGNFFDVKNKTVLYNYQIKKSKKWLESIKLYLTSLNKKYNPFYKKRKEANDQLLIDDILNEIQPFENINEEKSNASLLDNSFKENAPFENEEDFYYDDINEYNVINSNYKFFKIKKKNGGHREIMAPKGQLKNIQRWINFYILNQIEIHPNCFGFIKNRSIKNNAKIHINQECILNIDLLKFFDTITQERVFGMFKQFGYHPNLARLLASLTTAKHKEWFWNQIDLNKHPELKKLVEKKPKIIPQGAPTSPSISNIICRRLDNRLNKLALKCNCKYSRYADDITFSGRKSDLPTLKLINKIIREEGFFTNTDKIGFYSKGSKQYVTGLAINDGVRIPRKRKREIRQILHYCKINGVENHKKNTGIENKKQFKEWLAGNIAFIHDIEPRKAKKLWDKFNDLEWE
ncbi:hypothetical protein GCM10023314_00390 [Algibacter agarivorans]|uniref:RNA-directed DNA polymerase n=1 Tax=Algibacter agarivorans TaxID=1109741 RepID=A0ABP9G8N3_9FLAO